MPKANYSLGNIQRHDLRARRDEHRSLQSRERSGYQNYPSLSVLGSEAIQGRQLRAILSQKLSRHKESDLPAR